MVYLDTSDFSYDDWVGAFCPVGMPKREWLVYYACGFNSWVAWHRGPLFSPKITGVGMPSAPFASYD
jgi:hypothetical protein